MFKRFLVPYFVTLGVGKIPFAPGTWGSLLGLLIWWAISPLELYVELGLIVFFSLLSWAMITIYEQTTKKHDPKEVIVDEVVGQWIALIGLPLTWQSMLVGFVLFRFFDILKPFPISFIDRNMPGAFGTMCDDIVAGLFARILVGYIVVTWMM